MNNRKGTNVKIKENYENLCPSPSKKAKVKSTSAEKLPWKYIIDNLDTLQEMGISTLESSSSSDSSSSSTNLFNGHVKEENQNTEKVHQHPDQNLNEQSFKHPLLSNNLAAGNDCDGNNVLSGIVGNVNNISSEFSQPFTQQLSQKKDIIEGNHLVKSDNNKTISSVSIVDIYTDPKNVIDRNLKKVYPNGSQLHQQSHCGRSPLATVTYNDNLSNTSTIVGNNYNNNSNTNNNNQQIGSISSNQLSSTSSTTSNLTATVASASSSSTFSSPSPMPISILVNAANLEQQNSILKKHSMAVPDENFFLYKNRHSDGSRKESPLRDPFRNLSDEMILQILKWLPKKALIRCSYVCRRFFQLTQDESLWARLDLGGKSLRSGALGKIVRRRVVILRLSQAEMSDPVFEPDSYEISEEFHTKLQYLDLSMAVISKNSLRILLSKCQQLKKLSLEHVPLDDKICNEISKNINLEALNLSMAEGIEAWSIKKMMTELKQLHSLNISWTSLNVESVNTLVENVTPNLLRLNIAGCRRSMFDSHITTLVERCPQLIELDLSDCTALTSNSIKIVCTLKDLEYLSLSRCYSISAPSFMELKNLKSLAYLDVFGMLTDSTLELLRNTFTNVGINKFINSSVSRPTVGTRRTSIWGLRTRD